MHYQLCTTFKTSEIDVNKTITDSELYELIKTGGNNKNIYTAARLIGKGNPGYKELKATIQCYHPNVIFNKNERKNCNISHLTGEIYCDLDNLDNPVDEVKDHLKQFPFIKSIWISFSGIGIGFTVTCDNLTKDNYSSTYKAIGDYIGYKLDFGAKKLTQANIISYDTNIYINPNPTLFIAKDDILYKVKEEVCEALKKERHSVANFRFLTDDIKLKFKSELDNYNNEDFIFDINGKDFTEVFIPMNGIEQGNRKTSLISITLKLLYLNPNTVFNAIAKTIRTINKSYCKPELSNIELESLLDWCKKIDNEGDVAIKLKQRYIWFNPENKLSTSDKLTIVGQKVGELKRYRTSNKIKNAITELYNKNEIITQKSVAKIVGKSDRTIRKYWNEFKSDIDEANENIRTNCIIDDTPKEMNEEPPILIPKSIKEEIWRPIPIEEVSPMRFSPNSNEMMDFVFEIEEFNAKESRLFKSKFGKISVMYNLETTCYICFNDTEFNHDKTKHDRIRYFIFDTNGMECIDHYCN